MELRVQCGTQALTKEPYNILLPIVINIMKEKLTKTLNVLVGTPDLVWDASLEG